MSTEFTTIKPEDVSLDTTFDVYETMAEINNNIVNVSQQESGYANQVAKAQELKESCQTLLDAQLKVLEDYVIASNQVNLTVKRTFTIEKHENEKPPYTRYKHDEWKIEGKDNATFVNKYKAWREDINYAYQYVYKLVEANVTKYTQDNTSSQGAAIAFQQLLGDNLFTTIANIERQIDYRRFYFPGGEAKQKILKDGETIKTGAGWDPRYLEEYIGQAHQYGFHRWMLAPIGTTALSQFKPISYATVDEYLRKAVKWARGYALNDGYTAASISEYVAPLVYFDKLDDYVKNYEGVFTDADTFTEWIDRYLGSEYTKVMDLLKIRFGHSATEFKNLDAGYYAQSTNQAFDAAELAAEFKKYSVQYEEYKQKLWEIMKQSSVFQLCFNYADMTGNNININQTLQCNQWIGDNNTPTGTLINDTPGSGNGSGNGGGGSGGSGDAFSWKEFYEKNKVMIYVVAGAIIGVIVFIIGFTIFTNKVRTRHLMNMVEQMTNSMNAPDGTATTATEAEAPDGTVHYGGVILLTG